MEWNLEILIILLFLHLIYFYHVRITRLGKLFSKFPRGMVVPFLGNAYLFLGASENIPRRLTKYVKTYGRVCGFWKLNNPWLIVADAGVAEKVLSSQKLIEKGREYDGVRYYMGTGLLTAYAEPWRVSRKLLNPAFKRNMFNGFINIFNEQGTILVELLKNDFNNKEKFLDVHYHLEKCTLEMAFESTLGKPMDIQRSTTKGKEYLDAMYILAEALRYRMMKPWLTLPIIWHIFGMGNLDGERIKFIRDEIFLAIEERRAELKEEELNEGKLEKNNRIMKNPFIDILLTCENTANDEKYLVDHVMNLLGAGSETAASGMEFTLFLLALNEKDQEKVQEELDGIFGDDKMRDVTFDDLAEMKYLEMCIKESMRLYPPVPVITRTLDEDVLLDDGLVMPKDSDAVFLLYDLHRDPKVYPDSEKFKPERFTAEESSQRNYYAYLPFSAGIRNCIGHKYAMVMMKVVMGKILREFKVSTVQKREDIKLMYGMTLEVHPGIQISLTKRV